MNHIFMSKCTADKEQLKDRWTRGARHVEIHLKDNQPIDELEVEILTQNIRESGLKALVIHAPMNRTYVVESMGFPLSKERFRLVSKLASNMYEIHQAPVIIVIHQELSFDQIRDYGLIDGITETFKELIEEFPNIHYAFENLTIIGHEHEEPVSKNSHFDEPCKVAHYVREKLNTNRIGTVLDTCHLISTVRLSEVLLPYGFNLTVKIEDFFNVNKGMLKLIHLSNATRLGFGKEHGNIFTTEPEINLLKEIFENIKNIEYSQPITLEIVEEDNTSAEKYTTMRVILKQLECHNF